MMGSVGHGGHCVLVRYVGARKSRRNLRTTACGRFYHSKRNLLDADSSAFITGPLAGGSQSRPGGCSSVESAGALPNSARFAALYPTTMNHQLAQIALQMPSG